MGREWEVGTRVDVGEKEDGEDGWVITPNNGSVYMYNDHYVARDIQRDRNRYLLSFT